MPVKLRTNPNPSLGPVGAKPTPTIPSTARSFADVFRPDGDGFVYTGPIADTTGDDADPNDDGGESGAEEVS